MTAQTMYEGSSPPEATAAVAARLQQVLDSVTKKTERALGHERDKGTKAIAAALEAVSNIN